jgi:hypothetical protein
MKLPLPIFVMAMLLVGSMSFANQFIVSKKTKEKKESSAHVKEDVVELCESALRQLGCNVQQSVTAQNHIFDKIKSLCIEGQQSTAQLKELREKLEKYLKKLAEHQADLQELLITL